MNTTGFVFLFACVAFICKGTPIPGDGHYYDTKLACTQAAHRYAVRHWISLGRYEITCVEREKDKGAS